MKPRTRRPVFLNLTQITMPVGALTSIGHRISGVIIAVTVPAAVYLFSLSLRDEVSFARMTAIVTHPAFKSAAIFCIWAFAHHLLGGIRHMFSDFEIGSPLRRARKTAWVVNVAGLVIAILTAIVIW